MSTCVTKWKASYNNF